MRTATYCERLPLFWPSAAARVNNLQLWTLVGCCAGHCDVSRPCEEKQNHAIRSQVRLDSRIFQYCNRRLIHAGAPPAAWRSKVEALVDTCSNITLQQQLENCIRAKSAKKNCHCDVRLQLSSSRFFGEFLLTCLLFIPLCQNSNEDKRHFIQKTSARRILIKNLSCVARKCKRRVQWMKERHFSAAEQGN